MTMQYRSKAVVIGTGAGGGVAAAILAEAGVDTIVLEQGRWWHTEDHTDVVAGIVRMYMNAGMTSTLGRPPIPLPLGVAVGGTTIINSSTCFAPPREKVEAWGGPSWEEVEPFVRNVERRINAHSVEEDILGGNWRVVKRGCDALGIEIRPLMHNVKECKGRGLCQFGCSEGAKQSTDITFIPSAVNAGAKLLTEHKVLSLQGGNGRGFSVSGTCPEGAFEVRADVVVLAMGAMCTPAFLLKHRIANASGLVGRGLQIHPACRAAAIFDEIVDGHKGISQGSYIDKWAERGILLETIFTPPGPTLAPLPGAGHEYKALASKYRNMSELGIMVEDTSSGSVSPGRFGAPFTAWYQLNEHDTANLHYGMARSAEIYFEAGATEVFTNCRPMPVLRTMDDVRRFEAIEVKAPDIQMMAFHPVGTCRMGANSGASVVDFSLESHDVKGLYVMDASVVPASLGVNPQVTIMTLAMRAATLLAEKLR